MAEIRRIPILSAFWRHLRAEPTAHVILWRNGRRRASGPGLAFWFRPLGASIAEVPLDDREQAFVFRVRSADFQEIVVNGAVTWRVTEPELVASRIDFSIDTVKGSYHKDPLDRVAAVVTGLAQQLAASFLVHAPLREALDSGSDGVRRVIHDGLVADPTLGELGIAIVATSVAQVAPAPEVEKALQMPTRERIQQSADQATFERRALAVEKERAIQENELQNQIELARREETLIAQRGQNERKRATEAAESRRIEAEGAAGVVRLDAEAQAEKVRLLEEAKVGGERARMDIYRDLPPEALLGLAARELAGNLPAIEHLSLSPDILGPLVQRALGAGARRLEEGGAK